jgi:uncharacterized protein
MKSISRRGWIRSRLAVPALTALAAGSPLSTLAQPQTSRAGRGQAATHSFGSGATRVALLLETQSATFGKAAAAVQAGVRSAFTRDGQGLSVDVIPVSDTGEEIQALVNGLPGRGYQIAIGPLTRSGVNALADLGSLPLTVLALNLPDLERRGASNLIYFGLAIEAEARQVARAAFDDTASRVQDRRPLTALIISATTPLARRSLSAFSDGWRELGGVVVEAIESDSRNVAELRSIIGSAKADVVFASVGPDALRVVRSSVPKEMRIYGTSQSSSTLVGVTQKSPELDGVRLVGMPWQYQPDHAAVMAYSKAPTLTHLDFQRLYALGIDAFRLARELMQNRQQFELDGVTGRLRLNLPQDTRVERISVLGEYQNGVVVPLERR